ncbi:MAG: hypothetical protein RIG84_17825 [Roseovarius sp.]
MSVKTLCAALVGVFLATGVHAQSVEFRGGGVLRIESDNCIQNGYTGAGTFYYVNVRYRPARVGSNGNNARLSIFFDYFAMSHGVTGKLNSFFKNGQSVNIGSQAYETSFPTKVKLVKRDPSNVNANTEAVQLVVKFRNLDETRGCTASLESALFARP